MARCAACFLRRPRRVGASAPVPAKFGDRLPRSEQHTWSAQQWGDATTFSIVEQPAGLDDQERRSQGHATNPARANPYENYRAAIWVCQLPARDSRMNSLPFNLMHPRTGARVCGIATGVLPYLSTALGRLPERAKRIPGSIVPALTSFLHARQILLLFKDPVICAKRFQDHRQPSCRNL